MQNTPTGAHAGPDSAGLNLFPVRRI